MKVLIVDNDVHLLDLLTYTLSRQGYSVMAAVDGVQGLDRWETETPDIVLLDANLPKLDGFEVCRRIRHESDTPIIMFGTGDEERDIVRGLQLGADDYVTKPFSAKQLGARINAVLRRCSSDSYRPVVSELNVGDLKLELQSHDVLWGGGSVELTPIEFRLLFMLTMNANRVTRYPQLVKYVWGYDSGNTSLLKSHICHLREKLKTPLRGKNGIRAVPGVGYKLVL